MLGADFRHPSRPFLFAVRPEISGVVKFPEGLGGQERVVLLCADVFERLHPAQYLDAFLVGDETRAESEDIELVEVCGLLHTYERHSRHVEFAELLEIKNKTGVKKRAIVKIQILKIEARGK